MGGETEAQEGAVASRARWYLRGGDKCGFLLCGSDTGRAWGVGLRSKDTRAHPAWPRLAPPDQGLACVILHDPGPWGGGTRVFMVNISSFGSQGLGPQMPESHP